MQVELHKEVLYTTHLNMALNLATPLRHRVKPRFWKFWRYLILVLTLLRTIQIVSDNEPVLKAVVEAIRLMRQGLGLATTVTYAKPYSKGRTGQVERCIQTLRRQSSTVLAMLEDKVKVKFPMAHPVVSWCYVHSAWLLNRFANHSALRCTPFEIVNGRRYSGRLVNFGECVLVLQKTAQYKHGPRWFPGVWLGKSTDGNDDLHVVATPAGIVKSKAVRRTASPWKGTWLWLVKDFPYKPNAFPKKPLKLAPGFPVIAKPVEDKDKLEDKDAQDVLEYALQHGDSSDEEKKPEGQPQQEHETMETREAGSALQPELPEEVPLGMTEPKTPSDSGKVLDDSEIMERSPKARRTEPTSPASRTLSAPFFAGGVNRMTNDYEWEDELMDELGEESYDMEIEDEPDEGKPPQLTPGELQKVDEKAGMVEITRLLDMKVMELPTRAEWCGSFNHKCLRLEIQEQSLAKKMQIGSSRISWCRQEHGKHFCSYKQQCWKSSHASTTPDVQMGHLLLGREGCLFAGGTERADPGEDAELVENRW